VRRVGRQELVGRDFEQAAHERYGATILRPARKNEPHRAALSWIRRRIESRARTPAQPDEESII
jgi:hypothetical protein